MKEIVIKIPQRQDFKRWFDILVYKLRGGFKCKSCGAKMPFKHVQLETTIEGKRLILENHNSNICPDCTVDELIKHEDIVFKNQCECDWCHQDKITMSYTYIKDPNIFVTFGSNYWNGHYICKDCLTEVKLSPVKLGSGRLELKGKNTYYINELGLRVKADERNFRRH